LLKIGLVADSNAICALLSTMDVLSATGDRVLQRNVIKCWGKSDQHESGVTPTTLPSYTNLRTLTQSIDFGADYFPIDIWGSYHMGGCARMQTGDIKCWGMNAYGELGIGALGPRGKDPSQMGNALPVVNLGANYVTQISIGFTTCAGLDDGTVKCWGQNNNGWAGVGNYETSILTPGGAVLLGTDLKVKHISGSHANGFIALFEDGSFKAWGRGYGLGYGDERSRGAFAFQMGTNLPFIVLDTEPVVATAMFGHKPTACAITRTGQIKCWGYNGDGQLCIGTRANYLGTAALTPSFSDLGDTPACFRTNFDSDTAICEACLPGSFADVAGLSECRQCTAGTFGSEVAAESAGTCEACPVDSYSDASGSVDCTPCPDGGTTQTTGSSDAEQCVTNCELGSGFDGTTCTPCAAGTYSETVDASACQLCPPNTFSAAVAATAASTCTACTGSTSPAGSSSGADCTCTGGYGRYP
jgi:hypothetical protein